MLWRTLQTILVPAAVIGGYFLSASAGGFLQSAWDDFLGPFLIAYWIGLGFTYTWDVVRESVKGARPGVVAATVGGVLLVLVVMVGPIELIDDPWMFGLVIAPGIELALPYFRQRYGHAGYADSEEVLRERQDGRVQEPWDSSAE